MDPALERTAKVSKAGGAPDITNPASTSGAGGSNTQPGPVGMVQHTQETNTTTETASFTALGMSAGKVNPSALHGGTVETGNASTTGGAFGSCAEGAALVRYKLTDMGLSTLLYL